MTKLTQTIRTLLFVYHPNCDYAQTYSLVVTPAPDTKTYQDVFYSMQSASEIVSINTLNLWNRGDYVFEVTIKKTNYASALGLPEVTTPFNVRMIDPCVTTILNTTFVPQNFYSVIGQHELSYVYKEYTDTVSVELDDPMKSDYGWTLCGPRVHNISEVF